MPTRGEIQQAEVVATLRQADAPLSAYDILAELREANPKIAPTTVYRALNALIENGKVHRLESLNAYTLCQCGHEEHASIMSICGDCGSVEETVAPEALASVAKAIGKSGFEAQRQVIEVHGRCAECGSGQSPV